MDVEAFEVGLLSSVSKSQIPKGSQALVSSGAELRLLEKPLFSFFDSLLSTWPLRDLFGNRTGSYGGVILASKTCINTGIYSALGTSTL